MPSTTTGQIRKSKLGTLSANWIFATTLGGSMLMAAAFSLASGPQFRAAAEAALQQENQVACAKLGLGPETSRFAECAATLADVRTNYARRIEQSIL